VRQAPCTDRRHLCRRTEGGPRRPGQLRRRVGGRHRAPFDADVTPPGLSLRPQAIRFTDYLPHDAGVPLALGWIPSSTSQWSMWATWRCLRGHATVARATRKAVESVARSGAVPIILVATTPSPFPTSPAWPDMSGGAGCRDPLRRPRDTGDTQFGRCSARHAMRRLIESGATRGDRFLRSVCGLLPARRPAWMDEQGCAATR